MKRSSWIIFTTGILFFLWVGSAWAYDYTFTFNIDTSLSDVWIITGTPNDSGEIEGTLHQNYIGDVAEGESTLTISVYEEVTFATILGIYDSTNNGVAVTMQDVPLGQAWDEYFGDIDLTEDFDEAEAFSEEAVANHIREVDEDWQYYLEDFVCMYFTYSSEMIGGSIGGDMDLSLFSEASYGGTVSSSAAPVPEPTTMLLFGVGLAGLVGSKRKLKK